MAVLVEATAIIIRAAAVEQRIAGGWSTLESDVPMANSCSDGELVSICVLDPAAVRAQVDRLVELGLQFDWDGDFTDIALTDQKRGLITPCDWLEVTTAPIGIAGSPPSVAVCRLTGSHNHQLHAPDGWHYQGSLSEAFGVEGSAGPGGF